MAANSPVVLAAVGTVVEATTTYSNIDMGAARGLLLGLSITAASGSSPTLDIKLQRVGPNGVAIDLPSAALAQKTGTGTDDLVVYPGVAETANRSVSDHCGRMVNVVATVGGTTPSFTLSLVLTKLS
jgi:hypothetical protein